VLKIMHVVGARPNFPKTAPIMAAMARHPSELSQVLVHTGQHYDANMSKVFFEHLEMPEPDEFLNCGGGSHAQQTAKIMMAFEPVLEKHKPDWVSLVGDVNSTIACALVCSKLGVKVAHVEAGLRSRDRTMPEEINRLLTDQLSDLLFTPSRDGDENLIREGVDPAKIRFVGNVMIDTLVKMLPRAKQQPILQNLGLRPRGYMLVTLHRPSNVDEPSGLREILRAVHQASEWLPVVFPVHPRTRARAAELNLPPAPNVKLLEPLGYLDFMALMSEAQLVLTDSGGVQEETSYLGVPCLTARPNTERPVTLTAGSNRLVASTYDALTGAIRETLDRPHSQGKRPKLWDGRAAERIAHYMAEVAAGRQS
jgi:UDP-N-acetylglucosamine 2-epimerase (non-hydrolysing)